MQLKFACADFTFPLLSHEKVLELIAMLEFDGVDIGLFEGRSHLWPSEMFKDLKKSAKALKNKLDNLGLEPADIFLQTAEDFISVAPNHIDASVRNRARELFMKTVEFTAECNGKHMTALPGVYFEEESPEDSFQRCCEELAWRCDMASKAGIVFSIEAHLGSIVPNPQSALKLVKKVPGLTLTLDFTHFVKEGLSQEEVYPLLEYASHFHARGAAEGMLQASVNENTIDYKTIIAKMLKNKYSGYIGIEYVWTEWENCNRVDNLSETILLRKQISDAHKEALEEMV